MKGNSIQQIATQCDSIVSSFAFNSIESKGWGLRSGICMGKPYIIQIKTKF